MQELGSHVAVAMTSPAAQDGCVPKIVNPSSHAIEHNCPWPSSPSEEQVPMLPCSGATIPVQESGIHSLAARGIVLSSQLDVSPTVPVQHRGGLGADLVYPKLHSKSQDDECGKVPSLGQVP